MAEKEKLASAAVIAARARLEPFLSANPGASVMEFGTGEATQIAIRNPWNDKSVAFKLPDDDEMFDTLNSLILPERFTAIYHKDTKILELIWTAYKLSDKLKDITSHKFSFSYNEIKHKCHFGRSSDCLLKLAENLLALKMFQTSFRDMQSFRTYVLQKEKELKTNASVDDPVSFFYE